MSVLAVLNQLPPDPGLPLRSEVETADSKFPRRGFRGDDERLCQRVATPRAP